MIPATEFGFDATQGWAYSSAHVLILGATISGVEPPTFLMEGGDPNH